MYRLWRQLLAKELLACASGCGLFRIFGILFPLCHYYMTKKIILCLAALLFMAVSVIRADNLPPKGYTFGSMSAPTGKEWQSPEHLGHNRLAPRTYFFSFADVKTATTVLPDQSAYTQTLNGEWRFHWAADPAHAPKNFYEEGFDTAHWDKVTVPMSWNIAGLQSDGSQKYGTPIYVNQSLIFQHEVKPDDWRGGVMRTPPTNWTTFKHRNEVGSYKRTFQLPRVWDGREVFVHFDGVDSFFYLWVNGRYVGFSKNSRNAARFRLTPYLHGGANEIAVQVYRSSDGSFLEVQDMFRLPGIFRSVYLTSTPAIHIADLRVVSDADLKQGGGLLKTVCQLTDENGRGYDTRYALRLRLYRNHLYSDEVDAEPVVATTVKGSSTGMFSSEIRVPEAAWWSAEEPNRYTLVAELLTPAGKVSEIVSTHLGFRSVEIRTMKAEEDEFGHAGRYFLMNGKTIKLRGVNRHETNPATGKVISRREMERDVFMMKRANINHVRNSHYPDDPYWYYLCDKYGIYLEDEANIESHAYFYGKASLSHPIEWRAAHVGRVLDMVYSNYNHPSILIWSLGNEAGPGNNFKAAYAAIKQIDTSRPVQYERNNDIVDMGSNQYPSVKWVEHTATGQGDVKYPFHISEYAHSMGNACGNLVDYWRAIESSNHICGGAVWDWIDQAMYNYTPEGKKYLAYGGDFGDYPNDGQFVMNGIIFADGTPKPQYHEVKKVYQPVVITLHRASANCEVELFNRNYFTTLNHLRMIWQLLRNGVEVEHGTVTIDGVKARKSKRFALPPMMLEPKLEYLLNIYLEQQYDTPWAKAGYVQMAEQMILQPAQSQEVTAGGKRPWISMQDSLVFVKGKDYEVVLDKSRGTLHRWVYEGKDLIAVGHGPHLEPFRAFVNNDIWFYEEWFRLGLHNLTPVVQSMKRQKLANGSVTIVFDMRYQAPYGSELKGGTSSGRNTLIPHPQKPFTDQDFHIDAQHTWTVLSDGSVILKSHLTSSNPKVILPRLGYVMQVPRTFDRFAYYGRGPMGNYPDRKTGAFIGLYRSMVHEQMVDFPKPQDCANHEDVRCLWLTDAQGVGFEVSAPHSFSAQALPYSALDMTLTGHRHELPEGSNNYLHLDYAVTGLGGYSCGQGGPLESDCVYARPVTFELFFRPIKSLRGKNDIHPWRICRVNLSDE